MNPATPHPRPPAPPRPPGGSPVLQTLLIVGILLGGLLAGVFILRGGKKAPAGEGQEEKSAASSETKHDEHPHGAHAEHEGAKRVDLSPAKLQNARLGMEEVGPAQIHLNLAVFGRILPDEERLAHVSARFAGIVRKVNKRLGERVGAGEVLAVVESNESLQTYDLKAPLSGTIIERNTVVGEFVGTDKSLFTVADLGTVWVDFQIYQQDFSRLRVGQPVRITMNHSALPHPQAATSPPARDDQPEAGTVGSTLAYLSPFGTEHTQTMLARAHVANEAGTLRPGLFVTGEIALDEVPAPVAVREAAVQTLDGQEVVFVAEGDGFEARPVEIGRRDDTWAEILSGVQPGERYVAANAFILKAEIGKEGAEHED